MKILCVHQNFPGQYLRLAPHLAKVGHQVHAISCRPGITLPGVTIHLYDKPIARQTAIDPLASRLQREAEYGFRAAAVAQRLKKDGFEPDLVLAHPGWGEALFMRDIFPDARIILYCEFFFESFEGGEQFFPYENVSVAGIASVRARNTGQLLALDTADLGITPTRWQLSRYPSTYRDMIAVNHEGIDTTYCAPRAEAEVRMPDGLVLRRSSNVVTYVSRNLEPARGFPQFVRAATEVAKNNPQAKVVVVGGNSSSYSAALREGETYKARVLDALGGVPDNFVIYDRLPYPDLIRLFQISAVHVYLTIPFVVSWSLLEAMSCGCLVVAANVAPVREIITGEKNGLLVDFFDTSALAATIQNCLDRPGEYADMRIAARSEIEARFEMQAALRGYDALIDRVMR